MVFTPESSLVQLYVKVHGQKIKDGLITVEEVVPNLYNLREVVTQVLNEQIITE